jgi:hypothetical protein
MPYLFYSLDCALNRATGTMPNMARLPDCPHCRTKETGCNTALRQPGPDATLIGPWGQGFGLGRTAAYTLRITRAVR